MDCSICPKRRLCSGADCYYDHYPQSAPADPEAQALLEDLAILDSTEGRIS